MKTFIIDDDPISSLLTEQSLLVEGFPEDIVTFEAAEEALGLILKNAPDGVPDIIFLDLNMPEMDGWAFLDVLESHSKQVSMKCSVYILTSSLDASDSAKAESYALVKGFLHKPVSTEAIAAILTKHRPAGDTEWS
ncbi:response regulator [Pontibacter sp. SGAir0037]|uniref:response regulator n=1 Tax=Pontibacter sp. SGAir0037 TaxID=2571030 RepID=UPI0010CCEF61|nr:response regulator [Pontibacter sp. SGAir0037]QCR23585.1 response regulator [Pontibacter sp. SGAir0037]